MHYEKKAISNERTDRIIFIAIFILFSIITLWFFYKQAKHEGDLYPSDMEAYIRTMLGMQTRDDYPYPILFKTAALINKLSPSPQFAMAFTVNLFNCGGIILTKWLLDKQTRAKLLNTFSTFGLFICSMIHGSVFQKLGIPYRYVSTGSPTPWHNHTYIADRPFMLLAFVWTCYTLVSYEKDFSRNTRNEKGFLWKYFLFSAFLFLSTITKPSYTLPALFAAAIVMLFRLFRQRWTNFRQTFILALFYIPTLITLVVQYYVTFTGTNPEGLEKGIGVAFGLVWGYYASNIPLAILLGSAFPIVVLILNWNEIKTNTQYRFSWIIYLVSIIMALVLYEGGSRTYDFNFLWGKNAGMFLTFYTSSIILINKTVNAQEEMRLSSKKCGLLYFQWGVFILHIIMGLWYFGLLCLGKRYDSVVFHQISELIIRMV